MRATVHCLGLILAGDESSGKEGVTKEERTMMRSTVRLLCVACLSLFLVRATGEEPSSKVRSVLPGVGVKGIVEIGMNADEAKRALAEFTGITEKRHYSYDRAMNTTNITHRIYYDNEGILAELDGNGFVKMIQISVKRRTEEEETFTGLLSGKLPVSTEKPISRESVVRLLGELEEVGGTEKFDREQKGVDLRYRMTAGGQDIEVMHYYSQGIYCLFDKGYLGRIGIFEKRPGKSKTIISKETGRPQKPTRN